MEKHYKHLTTDERNQMKKPILWSSDPFKKKNWRHNFSSLRWLKKIQNIDLRFQILEDFLILILLKIKSRIRISYLL